MTRHGYETGKPSVREGDEVTIFWNDGNIAKGTVIWSPANPGELWTFELEDGAIISQNPLSTNFDCMVKHPAPPTEEVVK